METVPGYRSTERKPGKGRPRAITATEDQKLLSIIARRNRGSTTSQLSRTVCTQESVYQGCDCFQKDFMRQGCLQEDLLLAGPLTYEQRPA
ncbi:hypothetical protein AVEN_212821-1 [Araneus ventricosus]|uniref:Uncharacterized protein n=1 Tax=Araneus ventricosus TaxID=182803 RepID=A0A4Y2SQJ6_ARAVE|nr:hypothetical protein AVEN_212821-1 [Araneus ventricosus]